MGNRSKIYASQKAYCVGKIFWVFEQFQSPVITEKWKQEVVEPVKKDLIRIIFEHLLSTHGEEF